MHNFNQSIRALPFLDILYAGADISVYYSFLIVSVNIKNHIYPLFISF
jgi:hypothetical protein